MSLNLEEIAVAASGPGQMVCPECLGLVSRENTYAARTVWRCHLHGVVKALAMPAVAVVANRAQRRAAAKHAERANRRAAA